MPKLPKRFVERFKSQFRRYQKILESARSRDVNESDTVVIITDFLGDVLGYDKYKDLTTEFSVRSTYCDLAIKCDGRLCYLIEVKSVGTELKDIHLRQAVDYAANEGCEWVLLTNGIEWQAHRVRFEKPIDSDLVFTVDLLGSGLKPAQMAAHLFLIAKETSPGKDIDRYWRQRQATSRFVVAQVLLHDDMLGSLRRQIRRLSPDVKVTREELADLLSTEVLKRDVLEGEKAASAIALVKKLARRRARKRAAKAAEEEGASAQAPPPAA